MARRPRRAEDLGLDHAWTYDHLTWRDLRDSEWLAAVPTLAAAALTTRSIGRFEEFVEERPASRHENVKPFDESVTRSVEGAGGCPAR